jgi:hypothetical protein
VAVNDYVNVFYYYELNVVENVAVSFYEEECLLNQLYH